MSNQSLSVKWYGPYSFIQNESLFTNPLGQEKGVYLWTIPYGNNYLVYYVGQTGTSFAIRSFQHLQSYLNGLYRVYDPIKFAKGEKELIWGGMWKPDRKEPKVISEFLLNYRHLAPQIFDFIGLFRLFVAPVEGDERIRERIEYAIARSLNQQPGIIGSFQDQDIRYKPRKTTEESLKVTMTFPNIMGLSEELIV
jgi:hypothetical protein